MSTKEERNKALVVQAFDTLFNRRDYARAEASWSASYVQHSAHIPPGRDGLFGLVEGLPSTLRYEHQLVVAEGDYVPSPSDLAGLTARPLRLDTRSRRGASPSGALPLLRCRSL
jgi:hypothetical protein